MVDSNAMRKTFVVPDIKPLDQYDSSRARICASVGWLLAKSYGNAGCELQYVALQCLYSLPASIADLLDHTLWSKSHTAEPERNQARLKRLGCSAAMAVFQR
ncbi:Calmodulin-regulated spectrin-associated protein 2 [Anabarilius grahami]|uniref:Calmodulin-regulated spectrin-associated protein 2 n=1 Tax=Anabarilius grahami TaxID=495550 RepID=A0A3N0YXX6_ANAGA|nr:Calmodulin-regulated spectrin-associated protein 2 [Anabarilius grahami]